MTSDSGGLAFLVAVQTITPTPPQQEAADRSTRDFRSEHAHDDDVPHLDFTGSDTLILYKVVCPSSRIVQLSLLFQYFSKVSHLIHLSCHYG